MQNFKIWFQDAHPGLSALLGSIVYTSPMHLPNFRFTERDTYKHVVRILTLIFIKIHRLYTNKEPYYKNLKV